MAKKKISWRFANARDTFRGFKATERAGLPSGKAEVCKTSMSRFDSDTRLQFTQLQILIGL